MAPDLDLSKRADAASVSRRRPLWRLGWLVGLTTLACSGPTPQLPSAPTERSLRIDEQPHLPLAKGEELAATVRMFGLTVGKMEMSLSPRCPIDEQPNEEALSIRSSMKTAGVVRWFKTTSGTMSTDANSLSFLPAASSTLVVDGDVERNYDILFEPARFKYEFRRSNSEAKRGARRFPKDEVAYDTQSAFMMLRGWNPPPATEGFFFVVLGKHLWRTHVTFHGVQNVEVGDKQVEAVKLSGKAYRLKEKPEDELKTRSFTLWLANDSTRLPVLVEGDASYGTLRFTLDRHQWAPGCR